MNKLSLLTYSCITLLSNTVFADDQRLAELDDLLNLSMEELMQVEIVTIATGLKQSVFQAPAITSVITAQDIEAMGATNINEVLETVPGLHVARSDINNKPIYTIRGIYADANPQVLVLLNGHSLSTIQDGNRGYAWRGMPVKAIARIEIIRGPGSALYGADAFAGVINIITKNKEDINGTEVGTGWGSFDTRQAWLLHGGNYKGLDVAFALEYQETDGSKQQIEQDKQTAFDELFGTHASFAPGPLNLQGQEVVAHLDLSKEHWRGRMSFQGDREMGNAVGYSEALDPQGRQAVNLFTTDVTYHHSQFTKHWDVTAQLNYYLNTFDMTQNLWIYPPGAFGGAYPEGLVGDIGYSENNTQIELAGIYSGFKSHLIRLGMGYHYGDLYETTHVSNFGVDPATGEDFPPGIGMVDLTDTPSAFMPEKDRDNWYVFVQDSWQLTPTWELTSGLRYDNYSDFGSTLNPRLAGVWQIHPEWTMKLLYGRAFRAPALFEIYAINTSGKLGNPSIQPETIDTLEVALDYHPKSNLHVTANVFTYRWQDGIEFQPKVGANTFVAQNSGQQEGLGGELEVKKVFNEQFTLQANYSYQNSTDKTKHHDAGNAPHHHVYARSEWLFLPRWHFNTQLNWVADRERKLGDPRSPIDDYATVDGILRYQGENSHWGVSARVYNIFDADAREPSPGPDNKGMIGIPQDFPLAGRHFLLEMRYLF